MPKRVFPLSAAQHAADAVLEQLSPFCRRIAVAGSVRREREQVSDIEIVCVPRPADIGFGQPHRYQVKSYLANAVINSASSTNGAWRLTGSGLWKYRHNVNGDRIGFGDENLFMEWQGEGITIPVDIFMATPESFGMVQFVRTGDSDFVRAAAWRARKLGLRMKPHIGFEYMDGNTQRIAWCPEESDVFGMLALPWIEPSKRNGETAKKEMLNAFARAS